MNLEPDTSNASDSTSHEARPKLSLRSLGLQKKTTPDAPENGQAELDAGPDMPLITEGLQPTVAEAPEPTEAPSPPLPEQAKEPVKRPKLTLGTSTPDWQKKRADSPAPKQKSTLSLANKPTAEPSTSEPQTEAPLVEERPPPALAEAPVPSPEPPPASSKAKDLAAKRAAESAKIEAQKVVPPAEPPGDEHAFDALLGEEPASDDPPASSPAKNRKRKVIEPVKPPRLSSLPPFDDSEEGVEKLIISTFPRRNKPSTKRPKNKLATTESKTATRQTLAIEDGPPEVTIDNIRPSHSLRPPPPANARLHKGTVKSNRKKNKTPLLIAAVIILLTTAGSVYFFWTKSRPSSAPGLQTPSQRAVSTARPTPAPAPAQQSAASTPLLDKNTPSAPASPTRAQPSEVVSLLVESLPISMVRNSGAESILIMGGVAYRLNSLVDPLYGLRFIGFTSDGSSIVFEDANGARYAREF